MAQAIVSAQPWRCFYGGGMASRQDELAPQAYGPSGPSSSWRSFVNCRWTPYTLFSLEQSSWIPRVVSAESPGGRHTEHGTHSFEPRLHYSADHPRARSSSLPACHGSRGDGGALREAAIRLCTKPEIIQGCVREAGYHV